VLQPLGVAAAIDKPTTDGERSKFGNRIKLALKIACMESAQASRE
jgi:hypothetical protein